MYFCFIPDLSKVVKFEAFETIDGNGISIDINGEKFNVNISTFGTTRKEAIQLARAYNLIAFDSARFALECGEKQLQKALNTLKKLNRYKDDEEVSILPN